MPSEGIGTLIVVYYGIFGEESYKKKKNWRNNKDKIIVLTETYEPEEIFIQPVPICKDNSKRHWKESITNHSAKRLDNSDHAKKQMRPRN